MDSTIAAFTKGVHNLLTNEQIPEDAAADAQGFITQDGRTKLMPGRINVGAIGAVGKIRALATGYMNNGTQIWFRRAETSYQTLVNGVWTDIVNATGLTAGTECMIVPYSSLSGTFVIMAGADGIFKVHTANPTNALVMYDAVRNDKGKILINKARLLMWDLANASKTTIKMSWIDAQDGTVYTTVTGEVLGAFGGTHYTGTLAFKTPTRNCFGMVITGTTGAGVETFTDDRNGKLTSDKGGTGTINYATGAYVLDFNGAVTAGNVVASYQWEDSNQKGITDFTFSNPRNAGEGNRVTQDIGGDPIMLIAVGPDAAYYSLKQQSAYRLAIATDDKTYDNNVFYQNMGLPFFRAGIFTQKGIVFMNTSNPTKPEMTILQKDPLGAIIPVVLFSHFKFANYDYSDCSFGTYERYVTVTCKKLNSLNNDTILMCNVEGNTVDILPYEARMLASDAQENLYSGSPLTQTVQQILTGFDDLGNAVQNFWISKANQYSNLKLRALKWRFIGETLKKIRRLRFKGLIDPHQIVQVWVSLDDGDFIQIGTILGSASYVDIHSQNSEAIGNNYIGQALIGGDIVATAFPYFAEIKVSKLLTKFRKRQLKLIATGIGYFDFSFASDWDIMLFEGRLPKVYREKQEVSIDGTLTNQK